MVKPLGATREPLGATREPLESKSKWTEGSPGWPPNIVSLLLYSVCTICRMSFHFLLCTIGTQTKDAAVEKTAEKNCSRWRWYFLVCEGCIPDSEIYYDRSQLQLLWGMWVVGQVQAMLQEISAASALESWFYFVICVAHVWLAVWLVVWLAGWLADWLDVAIDYM